MPLAEEKILDREAEGCLADRGTDLAATSLCSLSAGLHQPMHTANTLPTA